MHTYVHQMTGIRILLAALFVKVKNWKEKSPKYPLAQ